MAKGDSAVVPSNTPAQEPPATEQDDTSKAKSPEEQFRDDQRAKAAEQGLTSDDAVPEQRPIASQHPNPANEVSDLTKKLQREGVINTEPMGKEAFDRADSDSQKEKAASKERHEAIKVADVVRVTKGPHEGRIVAVNRVISYEDTKDLAIQNAGIPEANFVQPAEVEGRARGDDRDGETLILNVKEAGLEKVTNFMGVARG